MTKDEWVAYEVENVTNYGQTHLSEFTSHRGRAPEPAPRPEWSGSILDETPGASRMDHINAMTDIVRKYQQRPDAQMANHNRLSEALTAPPRSPTGPTLGRHCAVTG